MWWQCVARALAWVRWLTTIDNKQTTHRINYDTVRRLITKGCHPSRRLVWRVKESVSEAVISIGCLIRCIQKPKAMYTFLFKQSIESLAPVSWQGVFEHSQRLKRFFIKISLAVTGHVNREIGIASFLLANKVLVMIRKSGMLFTSLYLKQCSTCLMRYYAGEGRQDLNIISGPWVQLSKSGIPTIIPVHHRHLISVHDERADNLVRLYLSLFPFAE